MDILVIGNGFDLAHDLKTSYKDFLDCCSKKNLKDCTEGSPDYKKLCENNLWMKHFIARQKQLGDTWIDLENEIYSAIEILKEHPAIKGLGDIKYLCPQLLSIQKDDNKFKFHDIKKYSTFSDNAPHIDMKEYMIDITEGMFYVYIKTPKGFINFLYDQLREFTKGFENYLNENICSPKAIGSKFVLSSRYNSIDVLSFNYTDICETFYKYNCNTSCQNLKINPIYVHGKADKSDNCNLVLGTHSFDNKSIPVDFNIFKKHNQRHKYGTIEAYQELLKTLNEYDNIKPVFHVIGHSLDKTDHNILKHVFLANKNAEINIYYHNEEAQERLINNITKIISEEEVMTKVRMIYQHDEERGILKFQK